MLNIEVELCIVSNGRTKVRLSVSDIVHSAIAKLLNDMLVEALAVVLVLAFGCRRVGEISDEDINIDFCILIYISPPAARSG